VQRDGERIETERGSVIDQIAGRIGNAVHWIVGRVRVEFDLEHPSDEVAMNVPLA